MNEDGAVALCEDDLTDLMDRKRGYDDNDGTFRGNESELAILLNVFAVA